MASEAYSAVFSCRLAAAGRGDEEVAVARRRGNVLVLVLEEGGPVAREGLHLEGARVPVALEGEPLLDEVPRLRERLWLCIFCLTPS